MLEINGHSVCWPEIESAEFDFSNTYDNNNYYSIEYMIVIVALYWSHDLNKRFLLVGILKK